MAVNENGHQYRLQQIVDERHQTAWTNPAEQDPRATLGMVISAFCEWDFNHIGIAFLEALEDANAHRAYAEIEAVLTKHGFNLERKPNG